MKKLIILGGVLIYANNLLVLEYQKINKHLDILNIENHTSDSIGNLNGFKIEYKNRIIKNIINRQDIKYSQNTLINYKLKFEYLNFIGIELNKGNTTYINSYSFMENYIKNFSDIKDVKITDSTIAIIKNDNSTQFFNLTSPPKIKISNLLDVSLYLKFSHKKTFKKFNIQPFISLKYTKIYTKINAILNPKDENTKEELKKYKLYYDLNRDEFSTDIGVKTIIYTKLPIQISYTYRKIFRNHNLNYINYNHIIDINIINPINSNYYIYIGSKIMYRQLNGEIPYLYNKFSQSTFDHKYGYLKIGIGYYF